MLVAGLLCTIRYRLNATAITALSEQPYIPDSIPPQVLAELAINTRRRPNSGFAAYDGTHGLRSMNEKSKTGS